MTHDTQIIRDAQLEMCMRERGRAARIDRLRDAGWPTERAALAARLTDERDAAHERAGGLFHACTVRVDNGVDPDLPTHKGIGCRITRVPINARLAETGEARLAEIVEDDHPLDEPYWLVEGGMVGPGWIGCSPMPVDDAATAEQAESLVRERLLARGDIARTRAEAEALVLDQLVCRTAAREM